jgi:hypothetical protein
MNKTPESRLARLADHVRQAWDLIHNEPLARERARRRLIERPSSRPEVDRLWLDCLDGRGPLAAWLAAGGHLAAWPGSPPLHSVLASHPFPDLPQWLIRKKFIAS